MSKKNESGTELQMNFLEEGFVYEVMKDSIRVRKMLLKGGFGDWLLVITARQDGVPVVCFIGSSTIKGVAAKLHKSFIEGVLEWKPDKYAD